MSTVCYNYFKDQGYGSNLSVAIASYNWFYYYRVLESIIDNIPVAHQLKTRIVGEAKIKTKAKSYYHSCGSRIIIS